MTNILFISHDVVGSAMAGPGIRAAELARVLAAEHAVTLATPRPADLLPPGVAGYTYAAGDPAGLAPALAAADLIVANGYVLKSHPELAEHPAPLVLDLYDPTPLENLALLREHDPLTRVAWQRHDVALLVLQLRAGDCLLCATERQRDLYLGALLAVGRVGVALADADPTLRGLLRVVPSGLSAEPPPGRDGEAPAPPWPPLDPAALVILWSGGLWDWMDPLTLIRAMPAVLAVVPQARLVFLAGPHPGDVPPMRVVERARALAAELGLLGRAVLFVDRWVPYAERAGALLNAALAVYLHEESLESSYAAVRSRFLDHLWAGLPSVVSAGDAAAALVAEHDLGRVVAPGDVDGAAAALIALLGDPDLRAACSAHARALAEAYTWERVAAPLLDFCRAPSRALDRPVPGTDGAAPAPEDQPSAVEAELAERDQRAREQDAPRNAALAALPDSHQLAERPLAGGLIGRIRRLLVDQIVRPFVAPLIEQQNAHNAAVLRALDALAENSDARRSEAYLRLDAQEVRFSRRLAALEARLDAAEAMITALNGQLGRTGSRVTDLERGAADLTDADTLLAERIAGLALDQAEERPR